MPWLVLLALAAGAMIAAQPPINTALTARLGRPISGALWNFVAGAVVLGLLHVALRVRPDVAAAWRSAPWWAWLGGVLGAALVTTSIYLLPRIGAATFTVAMVAGQIGSALLIDHMGLFHAERRPISAPRALGVALVFIGVAIVALGSRSPRATEPDQPPGPDQPRTAGSSIKPGHSPADTDPAGAVSG